MSRLCLFNFSAEYFMRNAMLDEAQAGIEIAGRNINDLRYADATTLMAESEKEVEYLDECDTGKLKIWLKTQFSKNKDHGIWSHHFMESRWETMEIVRGFIWGAPKSLQMVTAAMKLKDACSLE